MRIGHAYLVIALISTPGHVYACEKDPFLFLLPGETETDAVKRSEQIRSDFSIVERVDRESWAFEHAKTIYLSRILSRSLGELSSDSSKWIALPSTRIQPIHALKGQLPSTDETLTDEAESGMCTDIGDGHGSWSNENELVVVFVGLPKTQYRPRGIDSFKVSEIRTPELLDKLREFGKDIEDEVYKKANQSKTSASGVMITPASR
jgi:hypothetical protein